MEIEGTLLEHAAVQEVAVVGMPDEKWGEAPHAFVILKPGASATEDDMREFARGNMAHFKVPKSFTFVRSKLAHFKCPKKFHVVSELPKTATGKVQKYVLRGGRAAIATQ